MAEPTVTCPNCKTEIKLTESLAAPLLEASPLGARKYLRGQGRCAIPRLLLRHVVPL